MRIYYRVDPKFHESIEKNAKSVGLDLIGPERFVLTKVSSKRDKQEYHNGYINEGVVFIIGNESDVWIMIENMNSWFKTSPVLKCTETATGFAIETKNSHYKLHRS